jgi:hypothetical protein
VATGKADAVIKKRKAVNCQVGSTTLNFLGAFYRESRRSSLWASWVKPVIAAPPRGLRCIKPSGAAILTAAKVVTQVHVKDSNQPNDRNEKVFPPST